MFQIPTVNEDGLIQNCNLFELQNNPQLLLLLFQIVKKLVGSKAHLHWLVLCSTNEHRVFEALIPNMINLTLPGLYQAFSPLDWYLPPFFNTIRSLQYPFPRLNGPFSNPSPISITVLSLENFSFFPSSIVGWKAPTYICTVLTEVTNTTFCALHICVERWIPETPFCSWILII